MTKLEEAIEFVKNTGPGRQVLVFYRSGWDVVDLILGLGEIPYTVLNFDAKPGFVELVVDHFRRGEIAVLLAHRAFLTGICMSSKVGLEPTVLFTYEAPPEDVFQGEHRIFHAPT